MDGEKDRLSPVNLMQGNLRLKEKAHEIYCGAVRCGLLCLMNRLE